MKKERIIVSFLLLTGLQVSASDSPRDSAILYQEHKDDLYEEMNNVGVTRRLQAEPLTRAILVPSDEHAQEYEDDKQENSRLDTQLVQSSQTVISATPDATVNRQLIPSHADIVEVPVRAKRDFGFWETVGFAYVGTILTVKLVQDLHIVYGYWVHRESGEEFPTFDLGESLCCLGALATLGKIYKR